jgi:hypothetical protein
MKTTILKIFLIKMNPRIFKQISTLICVIVLLTSFQCKKETEDDFCKIQRSAYRTVVNTEGMIVYSNKYQRYAVSFSLSIPNNIDSQTIGFVCYLSKEMQTIGLPVIVSGTLMNFNADENMTPEMGGQELYFLEISQITKKP